jgi:hypothetical protein
MYNYKAAETNGGPMQGRSDCSVIVLANSNALKGLPFDVFSLYPWAFGGRMKAAAVSGA